MIEESMIMFNLYYNIGLTFACIYLILKVYILQTQLDMIPDPRQLLEELMKSKIPVLVGPDGVPTGLDMNNNQPKQLDRNPMVG